MIVRPKNAFAGLMRILDAINPVIVLLSIVGLFLEYTPLRRWVLLPNEIISLAFVADFILRLIAFPAGKYFFKGFGWVDFLASLPGLLILVARTPIFAVFKVLRIGRFFRIIRVLRFLRAFDFMKKMRDDSAWVQERIMQIGVSIVLLFVSGIVLLDLNLTGHYDSLNRQELTLLRQQAGNDTARLAAVHADTVYWFRAGLILPPDGGAVVSPADYQARLVELDSGYQLIAFSAATLSPDGHTSLPADGILVLTPTTTAWYNQIMLIVLGTLLAILTTIIFYMGYVFAKDMSVLQLIIDSFDAGDYSLLTHAAEGLRGLDGGISLDDDDDEISGLLKMAASLGSSLQADGAAVQAASFGFGLSGLDSAPDAGQAASSQALARLEDRLAALEGAARDAHPR